MNRRLALEAALERAIAHDDDHAPPFIWGVRDCTLRCADIVMEAIGVDPAEKVRGAYSTAEEASAIVGKRGLLYFCGRRAREIGARRIKIGEAETGDWGVAVSVTGLCSVLKYRNDLWFGCGDRGFSLLPSSRVLAAWSFC